MGAYSRKALIFSPLGSALIRGITVSTDSCTLFGKIFDEKILIP